MDNPGSVLNVQNKQIEASNQTEIKFKQNLEDDVVLNINKSISVDGIKAQLNNKQADSAKTSISIDKRVDAVADSAKIATIGNLKFYEKNDILDSEQMLNVKNSLRELRNHLDCKGIDFDLGKIEDEFLLAISSCQYYCEHRHPFTKSGRRRKKDVKDELKKLCDDFILFRKVKANRENYSQQEFEKSSLRDLMDNAPAEQISKENTVKLKVLKYDINLKSHQKHMLETKFSQLFNKKEHMGKMLNRCFSEAVDVGFINIGKDSYKKSIYKVADEKIDVIKEDVYKEFLKVYMYSLNLDRDTDTSFYKFERMIQDDSLLEKIIGVSAAKHVYLSKDKRMAARERCCVKYRDVGYGIYEKFQRGER